MGFVYNCITMDSLELESATKVINDSATKVELSTSVHEIIGAFRYLRNLCGTNPECQVNVIKILNVLENSKKILLKIVNIKNTANEDLVLCLRVGLQFLANLVVNNKINQDLVWNSCQELFDHCLKYDDAKVQNCCSMILYNIFLGRTEFLDELSHPYEDLIKLTMKESTSEFPLYILDLLVLKSNYIEKFYEHLDEECRIIVVEIIQNLLTEQHNPNIKPEIIKFFAIQFIKKSDLILKVTDNYSDGLSPVETIKILDLLVGFSSDDQHYLQIVQKETSLLINCIILLKNIHELSKQNGNNFTMLNKISDLQCEGNSSVQENPFFGFKCSLVRFIGNMCWKNSLNQNKVRELDCIPVVLDCCNIDERNPFIVQWCILVIRNICEKNIENQRFIALMSKEGKLDPARLKEFGIMLNAEANGDVLCIAPLKTDK